MNYSDILVKAFEKREKLFLNSDTNCFRLFNSAGDGIEGLTIDFYDGYYLIQYLDNKVREFLLNDSNFKNILLQSIERTGFIIKGCLVKNREAVKGREDYNSLRKSSLFYGEMPPEKLIVKQNGVCAAVDLVGGQSTGIFLDMREVRDSLASFYVDEGIDRMLNLFSYTCMFSVHALKNGVKHCVNVDLSKAVLKRGKVNYDLNSLDCDNRDFICSDALSIMNFFSRKNELFPLTVVDPPTFSRNKKKTFSVKKNYSELLQKLEPVARGGFVLTAVNSHSVSEKEYRSYHPANWELLSIWTESSDFPWTGTPYLKTGLWKLR